jgi:hypothetical protein
LQLEWTHEKHSTWANAVWMLSGVCDKWMTR